MKTITQVILAICILYVPYTAYGREYTLTTVSGVRFEMHVSKMGFIKAKPQPNVVDYQITLFVKNVSPEDITFPLGLRAEFPKEPYMYPQLDSNLQIDFSVPQDFRYSGTLRAEYSDTFDTWVQSDNEEDDERNTLKPSFCTVDPTLLKPGESALLMERFFSLPAPVEARSFQVEVSVRDNIKKYYDVWTGEAILKIDDVHNNLVRKKDNESEQVAVDSKIDDLQPQSEQARMETERKAEQAQLVAERKEEAACAVLGSAAGKDMTVDVAGVSLEMKWVPPGAFLMGSPTTEVGRDSDESPQTQVTIGMGFWLGRYEVTQAQWQALMGDNPANFRGADIPVENVSWFDAKAFCEKLTERERAEGRLPDGFEYTLPTEAQWEYACRAGTKTALNNGTDLTSTSGPCRNLDTLGWHDVNSGSRTHPVGQREPNAWGLYDMHGNVWEWCLDWYGDYPGGSVTDPNGPSSGANRVYRGGAWITNASYCRSAMRRYDNKSYYRVFDVGFRLALSRVP